MLYHCIGESKYMGGLALQATAAAASAFGPLPFYSLFSLYSTPGWNQSQTRAPLGE